ncbi:MAG: hypothetical protein IJA23_02660 [Clostridia bacterium]|nr:hypothetical protein [Clostridia bacterium]
MENEDIEIKEETTKTKSNKFKIFSIITILFTSVIMFFVVSSFFNNDEPEDEPTTFTINYSSVVFEKNSTYAYFYINSEKDYTIYANDFSVKIDGLSTPASGVLAGYINSYEMYDQSLMVNKYKIKISFDYSKDELDQPITFYYRGTILELGKAIEFDY